MTSHVDSNGRGIYSHVPAADTKASVALTATASQRWRVDSIIWSLDAAPAAALSLIVKLGTTTVSTVYLPAAGMGQLNFPEMMIQGETNEAVTVEISADSGGAAASLSVLAESTYSP